MKKTLYLDFETSDTKDGKRRSPSPYLASNFLVSFGFLFANGERRDNGYYFFQHELGTFDRVAAARKLQSLLDEADTLVAFNAKFELSWLYEAGFKFDGKIRDPMITEYILARGCKAPLSLEACAERRGVVPKKKGLVEKYWKDGLGFHEMPIEIVEEYGRGDIDTLVELDNVHQAMLQEEENKPLIPTIEMSWEFIKCLVEMERNGLAIDGKALQEVKDEFTREYTTLRHSLESIAAEVMGDTPINLDSPEQLSWVLYSRRVNDKQKWRELFNIGTDDRGKRKRPPRMSATKFADTVRQNTTIIKRTSALHCERCEGKGVYHKLSVSGKFFKRASKCSDCFGNGYRLENNDKIAGLKLSPSGPIDTAVGGFATDKDTLEQIRKRLERTAFRGETKKSSKNSQATLALEFVTKLVRYNAVGTYLETFVNGIEKGIGEDGRLHTNLNQAITSTGRLSSSNPNFQNMPRARTFPIRRVVVSRWKEGSIAEVDFAQLEFRVAVYCAQDTQGKLDILEKIDVHRNTSAALTEAGQPTDRQGAKSHTFKPLYGGSSGTEAEQYYYRWFKERYHGVAEWQERNINEALRSGRITIPSGRQFDFPNSRRTLSGYVTGTTQICNFPVQSFATADIVPVTIIECLNELRRRKLNSLLILTVHDSIVFDVYPGEESDVVDLIHTVFNSIPDLLKRRYAIDLNVPMGWEIKGGSNWMDTKQWGKGGHV